MRQRGAGGTAPDGREDPLVELLAPMPLDLLRERVSRSEPGSSRLGLRRGRSSSASTKSARIVQDATS